MPSILWQGPEDLLKRQSGFFRTVKPDPTNLFFNSWEQEKVAWGQIWTVGGMRYQLDRIFGQEVQCLGCGMCRSVVVVRSRPLMPVFGRRKLQASKAWGRQWLMYQSAFTVWRSSRGIMATGPTLQKKAATIFFQMLRFRRTFNGWSSPANTHTEDCRFVSGSYW